MYTYKTEASFSRALTSFLSKENIFHQRIESGTTGRGIPDLFLIKDGRPVWMELKRVHSKVSKKKEFIIPWRPGQQSWLNKYTAAGGMAYTVIAFDNCFAAVYGGRFFKENRVSFDDLRIFRTLRDLIYGTC